MTGEPNNEYYQNCAELRRRLKKDRMHLGRMCGAMSTAASKVVLKFGEQFSELEEDEFYKYLEIAKKTLSGTLGGNLLSWNSRAGAGGRVPLVPAQLAAALDDDLPDRPLSRSSNSMPIQ